MFEIVLSDISPGKTYPGIDAKVSLTVGNDTLIEKREFSIYKAIDNILKRIENPKGIGSSEPIFICSCGEVSCDQYDFRFTFEQDSVELELYTQSNGIFTSNPSRRVECRIGKTDFLRSLLRMISEYLSSIWNEEIHINVDNKDQILSNIKYDGSPSTRCLTRNMAALNTVFGVL